MTIAVNMNYTHIWNAIELLTYLKYTAFDAATVGCSVKSLHKQNIATGQAILHWIASVYLHFVLLTIKSLQ